MKLIKYFKLIEVFFKRLISSECDAKSVLSHETMMNQRFDSFLKSNYYPTFLQA